jgi:hypothetical protein
MLFACLLVLLFLTAPGRAQTGNLTTTFTPTDGLAKPLTISFTKPLFKFDNARGYWFVNPHNGQRHFSMSPDMYKATGMGVAYITLNPGSNDFDLYTFTNDSNDVTIRYNEKYITAPKYDPKLGDRNKPMHVHINSFTASEISFSISGTASLAISESDGQGVSFGTIKGEAHFYREPKYVQSEIMPGCKCDPAIYAATYDTENDLRTTSACEAALRNKVFDAVRNAAAPLFEKLIYHGQGQMSPGDIQITMIAGCINIDVPARERPWCSSDYYHNGLTSINAHKANYTNEDGYGLRFIKIPSDEVLNPGGDKAKAARERQQMYMDSMSKLMAANKITTAQYSKAMQSFIQGMTAAAGDRDIKKDELEHNLYIRFIFNANNADQTTLRSGDRAGTAVLHKVKGGAFEMFSPMAKDGDGNWTPNRMNVYLGKFSSPVLGKEAGTTNPVYPAGANKLTVYNIIIRMEGDRNMIDKAMGTIDFSALQDLITK